VIALSAFFSTFWWLITGGIIAAAISFKQWVQTAKGRLSLDKFCLRVPLLKDFMRSVETARFSRTMATLLESGVTISAALKAVTSVVGNSYFKAELQQITAKVKEGASLTGAIRNSQFFSQMAINLITVGEESGKLESGLYKLAKIYERETAQRAQTFVTILGPAVLVAVVGIVGFIIIAMLLPMFRMNMIIN
jgi:type II secretory pathway component PulF